MKTNQNWGRFSVEIQDSLKGKRLRGGLGTKKKLNWPYTNRVLKGLSITHRGAGQRGGKAVEGQASGSWLASRAPWKKDHWTISGRVVSTSQPVSRPGLLVAFKGPARAQRAKTLLYSPTGQHGTRSDQGLHPLPSHGNHKEGMVLCLKPIKRWC